MRRAVTFLVGWLVAGAVAAPAVVAQEDERPGGWPRQMETTVGRIIIYQPQLETFTGDTITGRAAVSVTPPEKTEPVFGTFWVEARCLTDRDERKVTLTSVTVPKVHFPDASDENEKRLADFLERQIPTWNVEMSLDRLLVSLDLAERERIASKGFNNDPPKIIVLDTPTVLVSIDGEPKMQKIENTSFEHVVNTAFVIIKDPSSQTYYLSAGADAWYASRAVEGPWAVTRSVPREIASLIEEDDPPEPAEGGDEGPTTPPAILVSTEPTELVVTDGKPEYSPMPGGELLYVSNTESDILMEIASQRHFVLLGGRWFASPSLTAGPWTFVASNELPPSFKDIPADSDELAHLRTWVDGTEEAKEAVLDAQVPQTAAVKRDATIEVTYDGKPKFEDIEETKLQYAVNTPDQVLKYGSKYYCVKEAVWYVADKPEGPWTVATKVPEEIQKIPASNPNYNVKYVHVYDVTPEVVYVGYYPGYVNSYVYGGCIVYGTGWHYRPWWGSYYYPRHSTWGFHVRWNPWYGWGFGFSYSTGRFTFSIGFGGWGGWYRGGWWGPRYRPMPYARGYHRGWHHGARAGYRAGYRTAQRQNLYRSANNRARVAAQPRATGARPTTANRPNNVVSDRSGNVHQRTQSGSWQNRAGTASTNTRSLDRTQTSRQRGQTRTQSYNRSRSGGGGMRRGGGGRRR